jgi:hypothetical protein
MQDKPTLFLLNCVVASGGDPTNQWVVPFEVRCVSIGCIAMTNALEPE